MDSLNDGDWEQLKAHMVDYDEKRETVIKQCRDMQKLAKHAIYSLHRQDDQKAAEQLEKFEVQAKTLGPIIEAFPPLRAGSYAGAMEEYAEAAALRVYLREGRLVTRAELPLVDVEEFLGGVLDFTGELNRHAVVCATRRDRAAVQRCRDLCDQLLGRCLLLDFRNGALRKKYDGLKYTVKKLESLLYELSLAEAMGFKKELVTGAGAVEPEAEEAAGEKGKTG